MFLTGICYEVSTRSWCVKATSHPHHAGSVQFYWHDYGVKNYVTAALHLADLQSAGKIRTLGVTNFDTQRLAEIVDAGVPIVANQIQYSLLDTRPENGMAKYCVDKNITLLPYGTLAGGLLSDKFLGLNPQDVRVNTYSLSKYASVINQRGGWEWFQRLLTVLRQVADTHDVSIADVASRWVLQRPGVGGIIVGARNADHAAANAKVFAFDLNGEDAAKIQAVLDDGKRPTSDCYTWERGGPW
jgi:aryl-alcohol dehydrogenase-like predicted oxidoreductase